MHHEDGFRTDDRACADVPLDFAPIAQRVDDIFSRTGNGRNSPRHVELMFDPRRDETRNARLSGRRRPAQDRNGRTRCEHLETSRDTGLGGERLAPTIAAGKGEQRLTTPRLLLRICAGGDQKIEDVSVPPFDRGNQETVVRRSLPSRQQ